MASMPQESNWPPSLKLMDQSLVFSTFSSSLSQFISNASVNKKGWEYVWVRYADAEDQDVLVKQPIAVYVERVYEEGDFAALGIGT